MSENLQQEKINILHQIMGYTKEIKVQGVTVRVSSPNYQEALNLRRDILAMNKDLKKDMSDEDAFEFQMSLITRCILACVKDQGVETLEDAGLLFMNSGGDAGELAKECYGRCGLNVSTTEEVKEAEKEVDAELHVPS